MRTSYCTKVHVYLCAYMVTWNGAGARIKEKWPNGKNETEKICRLRLLCSNSCTNSCKCLSVIQVLALTDDALIQATIQWMAGWLAGWMNEWMDEWMNGWMKQTNKHWTTKTKSNGRAYCHSAGEHWFKSRFCFVYVLPAFRLQLLHSWLYIIRWLMVSNWAVAIHWAHARERSSSRATFFFQWNKII